MTEGRDVVVVNPGNAGPPSATFPELPDGVSPFLGLLKTYVNKAYGTLPADEKLLVIAMGYLSYCEEKKYVIAANAIECTDVKNNRNVTHVYERYLRPEKIAEFASVGYGRALALKADYAMNSIAECARNHIKSIDDDLKMKTASLTEKIKQTLEPGLGKKITEIVIAGLSTFLVTVILTLGYYSISDKGMDSNMCNTAIWLLKHSGHGGKISFSCDGPEMPSVVAPSGKN